MNKYIIKRKYTVPQVLKILLDNEISLQLESGPPTYENEGLNNLKVPEYLNRDPFKDSTC